MVFCHFFYINMSNTLLLHLPSMMCILSTCIYDITYGHLPLWFFHPRWGTGGELGVQCGEDPTDWPGLGAHDGPLTPFVLGWVLSVLGVCLTRSDQGVAVLLPLLICDVLGLKKKFFHEKVNRKLQLQNMFKEGWLIVAIFNLLW